MKKICALVIAIIFMLGSNATAAITSFSESSRIITNYDAFGVALGSTTTTTTTTRTQEGSNVSTTVSRSVVESRWIGGSIKAVTINNTSDTTDSDGSESHSNTTDTYRYDGYGRLTSASGAGSYSSREANGQSSTGTITRSYTIKDAQALLTQSRTQATIKGRDNQVIGSSTDTTTINSSDYEYKGGSWVPKKTVSNSSTNMNDGSSTNITRTLNYSRNSYGVVTGLNQTATGTRVEVVGQNNTTARRTYDMVGYSATPRLDSKLGWYIASDDYTWRLRD